MTKPDPSHPRKVRGRWDRPESHKKPKPKKARTRHGPLETLREAVAPLVAQQEIQARLQEIQEAFPDIDRVLDDLPEPAAVPFPEIPLALPAPPAEPGLVEHARTVTDGGLAVAQFYLQTMQGTITPTQRQMDAAKELASWIGHKPVPPAAPAAGGTTNFTQMILRVAGATDDDLAALDRRPSRVPREVMEAQYSTLVVGGQEAVPEPEPVDFEETWDDS